MKYAIFNPKTGVLEVSTTMSDAIASAKERGFKNIIIDEQPEPEPLAILNPDEGPTRSPRDVALAHQLIHRAERTSSGQVVGSRKPLTINHDDVMRMTLGEAFEAVAPFFPDSKSEIATSRKKGPVFVYDRAHGLVDALLGKNKKLEARSLRPGQRYHLQKLGYSVEKGIDIAGLSLLPAEKYSQISKEANVPHLGHTHFCVGSSPECRQACLAYSGKNTADPYNAAVKYSRSSALLWAPEAFARVLLSSIAAHGQRSPRVSREWQGAMTGEELVRSAKEPTLTGQCFAVRLNVFSDLPWERIWPELFETRFGPARESACIFYDYTKVEGRRPLNYDLTFSYSGRNREACERELAQGRRVAVVFLPPTGKRAARMWDEPLDVMPQVFWKRDVVDGVTNDARFLNPSGVIVGLIYKVAIGQEFDASRSVFVVPCEVEDGIIVASVTPTCQPSNAIVLSSQDQRRDGLVTIAGLVGRHLRSRGIV
jgi:hypothetical protein